MPTENSTQPLHKAYALSLAIAIRYPIPGVPHKDSIRVARFQVIDSILADWYKRAGSPMRDDTPATYPYNQFNGRALWSRDQFDKEHRPQLDGMGSRELILFADRDCFDNVDADYWEGGFHMA
jgi:hypothetical protein